MVDEPTASLGVCGNVTGPGSLLYGKADLILKCSGFIVRL